LNPEDIPAPPILDLEPIGNSKNGYLTMGNSYPYFVCKDCLHFICFFDIVDKEPTPYAKAVGISEFVKEANR